MINEDGEEINGKQWPAGVDVGEAHDAIGKCKELGVSIIVGGECVITIAITMAGHTSTPNKTTT